MNEMILSNNALLHVRFDGRSWDMPLNSLTLDAKANDVEIRAALARHLDIAPTKLQFYVIERHANGNLTLRPEAVFG